MTIRIKNWKLAILALLFFSLFLSLGFWQLARGQQKKVLLQAYKERAEHAPLTAAELTPGKDWRFYQAKLVGHFDNAHTLLLDNKTFHGNVGYEVYTPFKVKGMETTILIDRGFIPMHPNRAELPKINAIIGEVTIVGLLNLPPTYVSLGQIHDAKEITWPLRIEYANLNEIAKILDQSLFPYTLSLTPHDPAAYDIEWQIVIMPPERHLGYAVQWFALALTLLILFVALNRDRK